MYQVLLIKTSCFYHLSLGWVERVLAALVGWLYTKGGAAGPWQIATGGNTAPNLSLAAFPTEIFAPIHEWISEHIVWDQVGRCFLGLHCTALQRCTSQKTNKKMNFMFRHFKLSQGSRSTMSLWSMLSAVGTFFFFLILVKFGKPCQVFKFCQLC